MIQRINLDATQKAVREFIQDLGAIRHPIELVSAGKVVARVIAPSELSDTEKQRILKKGRAAVDRARLRTKGMLVSQIQKLTDDAVREVPIAMFSAVVDTNVIVAGTLTSNPRSASREVIDRALNSEFTLVLSPETLVEIEEVQPLTFNLHPQPMSSPLLPPSFLFRFSVPCRYRSPIWTEERAGLDESFGLIKPAELDGRSAFAEFKIGWSEQGLAFSAKVSWEAAGALVP